MLRLRTYRTSVIALGIALASQRSEAQCPDGSPGCGQARAMPPARSVAVLPFRSVGPDTSQRYFADGVADAITSELSRIAGLKVTAPTSAFVFRDRNIGVKAIADSLGVTNIVDGTVMKVGDRVRITAQLVDARTGFTVWSDRVDRTVTDIFEIQEQFARTIAESLGTKLAPTPPSRRKTTLSTEVVERYARARNLLQRRSPSGMLGAIDEFRAVIRRDPSYAAAHAGLSSAYALAVVLRAAPGDSMYRWAGRALAASNRAIRLDSTVAEGYAARGYVGLYMGSPTEQAEADLVRAIRLRPSYAESHNWHAQLLAKLERYDEARVGARTAMELDPLNLGITAGYITTALMTRDHRVALDVVHPLNLLHPELEWPAIWEGLLRMALGQPEECLKVERMPPGAAELCLHALGRVAEARAHTDSIVRTPGASNRWTSYNLMMFYAWTADIEALLRVLEEMYAISPAGPSMIDNLIFFDPVIQAHGNRFATALAAMRKRAWERVSAESRRAAVD